MTRLLGIWRSWTLLRQLVIGVSAVVMVVLVTVGTTSVLSLRGSVLGIIDAQLSGSADGFSQAVTKYRITPDGSGNGAAARRDETADPPHRAGAGKCDRADPGRQGGGFRLLRRRRGQAARRTTRSRRSPNCPGLEPNRAQSTCRSWVTTGWWPGPATATRCS